MMKKLSAILLALCLICAACAATADMEIPLFDELPGVVLEDDTTTVEEASFEGEWVLSAAFDNTEYIDEQTLSAKFEYNFMPYVIGGGKISQDVQNEYGEFVTEETPYTFEAGQLTGEDDDGRSFVVELLEDGNILLTVFYAGEGEEVNFLSVYLVHPEK